LRIEKNRPAQFGRSSGTQQGRASAGSLRGKLAEFHSIRVNQQWRLIFQWNGSQGDATGVYLDDHSYR
jgi:plasmid maintenance system killer protein